MAITRHPMKALAGLATLCLVLAACGGDAPGASTAPGSSAGASGQDVAKIAVLAPITGDVAADGEEMVRGAQLAVDEINAAGGVGGYQLEVVVGDAVDLSSDAVTSAVERLSGDPRVNVFMTGYATLSNFEIDLMAEMDMPYMVAANSTQTEEIISPNPSGYPTVWSLTPSYDVYGTEFPRWVESLDESGQLELRNREFYVITSDNPYSASIAEGMRTHFLDLGWTEAGNDTVPSENISDWRSIISKIRTADPDVVIQTDFTPANEALFMQQFLQNPTDSLVYIEYGPSIPEFLDLTQDDSTGVIYALAGAAIDSSPRTQEIQQKFEDAYGVETGLYGVVLYEEVYLYRDALGQVGDPTDRLAIGQAIGEMSKDTALGHLEFDPETHLAKSGAEFAPFLIYQIWDGDRIVLWPENLKEGDFQLPPWMQ